MYSINNGVDSFDDALEELGFSFGGVLKAASPLLKVASAVGIPGAGLASVAVDAGSALAKKKKKAAAAAVADPTTASRVAPTTASRVASTASSPSTSDDVLHARVAHIAATMDRNQLRAQASDIIRSKVIEAKYKRDLVQKINKILKQLNELDLFVHTKLNVHTKVIKPGVIDILGGRDFVSNLGR